MKHTLIPALIILAAQPASAASLYTADHGDIGLAYEAGALEPHYHLGPDAIVDGAPVGNAPDGLEFASDALITFVAHPSAARPAGAQWDFMGTPTGNPIWFLPQTEDPAKPFLGIATEELDPADWTGSLTMRLTAMSGPAGGQFSLYQSDIFGNPVVSMATGDGISIADSLSLAAGGHRHDNYIFTAPGLYELTFLFSGTHAVDGPVSASGTYTFGVTVPEPSAALLGLAAAGMLIRRRRA